VSRRARNRAAAAAAVALVAGIVLAGGQVTGAFALFTGETTNQASTFSGGWIPAPSGASSALAGSPYSQETLSWTSGASTTMPNGNSNPVTGQTLQYADGGSGGSASCGSYGSFKSESAGTTSDSVTGTNVADWWCFQVISTSAGPWTSAAATFTPRRLFVPNAAVTLTEAGGHSGQAENGDKIAIQYNQTPTNPGTIAVQVCSTGSIYIGAAACGGSPSVGVITGLTITSTVSYPSSTSSVAGSTVTITLGGASNGASGRTPESGTGSFTGSGSGVTSSGGQNVCTSSPTCSVSTSGHF